MSAISKLHNLGQSIWYDNIERRLLENGALGSLIEQGDIRGVTSNPSIFHKAIAKSTDYDSALKPMAWAGWSAEDIFYQLAVEDIRDAADLFLPLYHEINGGDGYVSLEVSPYLAHDTAGTIAEAQKLWDWVDRPNLMIKIPATLACLPAITQTIAAGINVNVTLIFSIERYEAVMDAYLSGLETRLAAGQPANHIASVASFFVSRADAKIDKRLDAIASPEAIGLKGKAAIANTVLAYKKFKQVFTSERFEKLKSKGAVLQRPLWASTGTKDPTYSDVLYVDELIAPHTVNTVPPKTLDAYRDHGAARLTLEEKADDSYQVMKDLEKIGISMTQVTNELEEEGVKSFAEAFTALLATLEERCEAAVSELGPLKEYIPGRVTQLEELNTVQRLFDGDPSLWTDDPAGQKEIVNRLGWLHAPTNSQSLLPDLNTFASDCQAAGFTHALLLGMGGSSLASEVMRLTLGIGQLNGEAALDLAILDSTHPEQVKAALDRAPLKNTLFIVSSKSGSTGEIIAFLDYFWDAASRELGDKAGEHFIAITDSGSKLEEIARQRKFRGSFPADANVGGRYSALIAFGLVPAALMGLDVAQLLKQGQWIASQCTPEMPAARNPGLVLGAIMGEAALQGRDKLRIITDPDMRAFGSWLEQLVAESSGKQGKGIVPVDGAIAAIPPADDTDRLFVYLRSSGAEDETIKKIRAGDHPVLELVVNAPYDLGDQFYRWQYAVAMACVVLGVNAFDQPDVQDSKIRTNDKIAAFRQSGQLDEGNPIWSDHGGRVYGRSFAGLETTQNVQEVVSKFVEQNQAGDYIAINAYLVRNDDTFVRLDALRRALINKTGRAVTLGFGPRFLHSTGQLHKGGGNNGLFLQLTSDPAADIEIPGQDMKFSTLLRAQALGDLEALMARERRVIRVHLDGVEPDELLSG
jgi:transaldolase / glucose-6-phosphate isomerase